MKNSITFSLLALGLTLPAVHLQAQEDSRPQRGPRGDRPVPAFEVALDANKDGTIDKSEITESTAALKKLDKDSDGKVSMRELRGAPGRGPNQGDDDRPARPRGERPDRAENERQRPNAERPAGPPLIAALDTNKDGSLDNDELTAAPTALLKLDKNSDGQLSTDEFHMARGPRAGGPGARGGQDGERPRREGRAPRDSAPDKN